MINKGNIHCDNCYQIIKENSTIVKTEKEYEQWCDKCLEENMGERTDD